MCITTCRNSAFQYAALQSGNQCFCGNSYEQCGKAQDYECYAPCGGNGFEQCGGYYRNSIYSIQPIKAQTTTCRYEPRCKGCFLDNAARDVAGTVALTVDMTVEMCVGICSEQGYTVAALQFASQCFCGNSYGFYGQVSEDECNVPCMGDSSQMCGGGWRNNVYTIVKQCEESQVPVAAPVPPVDRSSKFSWTDKGFSSPVKDQQTCGSCWAHSAVTSLESNRAIKYQRPPPVLSVQQALDCSFPTYDCNGKLYAC
jgi:hypothetical protein